VILTLSDRKDEMKVNIENAINQALSYMAQDPYAYKYTIQEFINNLKEVKKMHERKKGKEALNKFFELYVFNKDG